MAFAEPIAGAEARQIVAWHLVGLSHRDMRDLMRADDYPHPVRSPEGIRGFLKTCGYVPVGATHGPNPDGPQETCDSDRHPGEVIDRLMDKHGNPCPRCRTLMAKERRERVRAGLDERLATLLAHSDAEVVEIAEWIKASVRPA